MLLGQKEFPDYERGLFTACLLAVGPKVQGNFLREVVGRFKDCTT